MANEARAVGLGRCRWLVGVVVVCVVAAGSLWYAVLRSSAVTDSEAVAACSQLVSTSSSPALVGLGSSSAITVFKTRHAWQWCFVGTGSAPISTGVMRATVGVPGGVIDGPSMGDVLLLVHLNTPTTSVVVDTASSRSKEIAHGDGFEVLRIAIAKWPKRVLGTKDRVVLGRIMGFNDSGQVTSSQPFAWCLGSINALAGSTC